jgi:hypothetical protein
VEVALFSITEFTISIDVLEICDTEHKCPVVLPLPQGQYLIVGKNVVTSSSIAIAR